MQAPVVIPAGYMLGARSELATERREGLGTVLVLRMAGEPEGSSLSEVILGWLGGSSWALQPEAGSWAGPVYRRLHEAGVARYSGARTADDRPIWALSFSEK